MGHPKMTTKVEQKLSLTELVQFVKKTADDAMLTGSFRILTLTVQTGFLKVATNITTSHLM